MVALRDSLMEECSVVSRVRQLLDIVADATRSARSPSEAARLVRSRATGCAESGLADLADVGDRLAYLRSRFPDLKVEEGPLVARARALLSQELRGCLPG